MSLVPGIDFQLIYSGKDITADVSDTLVDLSYTDNVKGHADEIELTFDDKRKLWRTTWYPTKGDVISARIGMDGNFLECGDFRIDETNNSGPPAVFKVKGIATFLTKALRTKRWFVHENKTLKQIAQVTCDNHGLTLDEGTHTVTLSKNVLLYSDQINTIRNALFEGKELETTPEQQSLMFKLAPDVGHLVRDLKTDNLVSQANIVDENFRWTASHISNSGFDYLLKRLLEVENSLFAYRNNPEKQILKNDLSSILVNRDVQDGETDLEYLLKIANQYSFTFNIKGTTMIFYMISTLEDRPHSDEFTPTNRKMSRWDITTKTHGIYKKAVIKHHDWQNQQIIESTAERVTSADPDGNEQSEDTSDDTLEIRERVENQQQADAKAAGHLHKKNKQACSGTIDGPFNMMCTSGNNIKVFDIGEDSGIFHIDSTTFTLNKNAGSTFSSQIHRVAFVSEADKNIEPAP